MNIELIVTGPVPVDPRITNTFELVAFYEHGDADMDTESVHHYKASDPTPEDPLRSEIPELKRDLIGFVLFQTDTFSYMYDERKQCEAMRAHFAKYGIEDHLELFVDGFFEKDRVYDSGTLAACTGFDLYWYDAEGVKHFVDVRADGDIL